MAIAFLQRCAQWLGWRSSAQTVPPPAAPPSPAPADAGKPRASAAARPAAAASPSALALPPGLGARRPLVAADGALAGFEFHVSAPLRPGTHNLAEMLINARCANLLGAMRLGLQQGLLPLASLPASWLLRLQDDSLLAAGMHLVLQAEADPAARPAAATTDALLQRLRRRGVRVGWPVPDDDDESPPGKPDFLCLRPSEPPPPDLAAWRIRIARVQQRHPGVPLLLLDLPDVELLEQLMLPPVTMAACATGIAAPVAAGRMQALPPDAKRLMGLLNRLVRDDDHALVVADIKADAALSLRLLQLINSAGLSGARRQPLESIEQAVLVLGRDTLYRWVAQLLVRLAPPRPAAQALQSIALARARWLELLGRAQGDAQAGGLYLLGLATLLPMLLQCDLDEALRTLRLPTAAAQALRGEGGPWLRHLALLNALERRDMVAAEALALNFGGLDQVLQWQERAWQTAHGDDTGAASVDSSPAQATPAALT